MTSRSTTDFKTLSQRLDEGLVVVLDGHAVIPLEKRGYVKAGPFTMECTVESPEAIRQLHREYLRAGATVIRACTSYSQEDILENRGNDVLSKYPTATIVESACKLAAEMVKEYETKYSADPKYGFKPSHRPLVCGSVTPCITYMSGAGKGPTQEQHKKVIDAIVKSNGIDFLMLEKFESIEEAEWATEVASRTGLPVVTTLSIGPDGDMTGTLPGECALRLARAGAKVVGVTCYADPWTVLRTLKLMKEALEKASMYGPGKVQLLAAPIAYHTPDISKNGWTDTREFPFALEPRVLTRFESMRYAREAYNLGIRFIGGGCGFEPYHIRSITEELSKETGGFKPASEKHGMYGSELSMHSKPWVRARAHRAYWESLEPATGRTSSAIFTKPSFWRLTVGDPTLKKQKERTSEHEVVDLLRKMEVSTMTQTPITAFKDITYDKTTPTY